MVDHMSLLRDFFAPFEGLGPGMASLEDCEGQFTDMKAGKMTTEEYLVRHS